MKLSVVIPTHNRADVLQICLERLSTQEGVDFEVIVVDDGSSDHTDAVLKKAGALFPAKKGGHKRFHSIKQEPSRQAVARNKGAAMATGDVIVFIGDDILVEDSFLAKHAEIHYEYPEEKIVVLGFTTWDPTLQVTDYMKFLENSGWQFGYQDLEPGMLRVDKPYKYFYTSNISLKKSLFDKEKFNEQFKAYGWEDIELGYRLWKHHSMRIMYEPRAIGLHHHVVDEVDLPHKMEAIGASAVLFEKLQPEVRVIPRGLKRTLLEMGTKPWLLHALKWVDKDEYYKAKSWEQFMLGVKSASGQ